LIGGEGSVTTSVGGTSIYYVEKGDGTPVLYVHGNNTSSRSFEKVMDVPGCRTVALDMPNFGRSGPLPAEVTLDRYADVVLQFAETLRLDRPVLVGHSLGGGVAISMAARHPERFRALVLVDSMAPSGMAVDEKFFPYYEALKKDRAMFAKALGATMPTLKDAAFFDALVDEGMLMAAPAVVGNARALGSFNYKDRCGSFTAPVHVIWGRGDLLISEAGARETTEAFPGGRLHIEENVGHSPMIEDPAGFLRALSGFVAGL
jgi:branched-chain amino acid transport system permease protein